MAIIITLYNTLVHEQPYKKDHQVVSGKKIYVFIVSYKIAKCIKEITRGSEMGRYFND